MTKTKRAKQIIREVVAEFGMRAVVIADDHPIVQLVEELIEVREKPRPHRIVTTSVAARELAVSPDWVYGQTVLGCLPCTSAGDEILIDMCDLESLILKRIKGSGHG